MPCVSWRYQSTKINQRRGSWPQAPNLRGLQLREVAVECEADLSASGDLFVQTWTLHAILGLKRMHARKVEQETR